MRNAASPQHLNPEAVEEYFRLGVRSAFTLSEQPQALMVIDPARRELQLRTPVEGGEPEVAAYERLSLSTRRLYGADWYELTIDATGMRYEAYVLVESIADQLRAGTSFRHAVSESLEALKDLLASRRRLTEEKVSGLIGELIVLQHVIARHGEDTALAAWLGPLAEEHDFGFLDFDAEVKTTRSESRVHVIGSDTQLEPVPGRELYLISVQITRAGAAADAFSLPDLVLTVRGQLLRNVRAFDAALEDVGWRDSDADLYRTRYQLRSMPRGYLVDDVFPAITASRLDQVVPQRTHVLGVTYRVDVSQLDHSRAPAPLSDLCEEPA